MLQQSHSTAPLHHSASQGNIMAQNHRNSFHAGTTLQTVYRHNVAPIQPYAFRSTPSLNTTPSPTQRHQLPAGNMMPQSNGNRAFEEGHRKSRSGHHSTANIHASKRDSASSLTLANYYIPPAQTANMAPPPLVVRPPQPDRYRRGSSSSQNANRNSIAGTPSANMYQHANMSDTRVVDSKHIRGASGDLSLSGTPQLSADDLKRLRRRSIQTLDHADFQNPPPSLADFRRASDTDAAKSTNKENLKTLRLVAPIDQRGRSGSFESATPTRNGNSSAARSPINSGSTHVRGHDNEKSEPAIPPRGSSSVDATKRTANSSPLSSHPVTVRSQSRMASSELTTQTPPSPEKSVVSAAAVQATPASETTDITDSPAAKKLAAIKEGGKSKTKTSRLRRAFSFGSVTEFRRAAAASAHVPREDVVKASEIDKPVPQVIPRPQTASGTLRNQPSLDNVDEAEQERIARKQEASGLGNSIYGGRFGGSTDNLSISSTASSASIMIRKMGRGMKRGGRSLAGLFRPKSIIGAPLDSGSGVGEISMINVEADRQRTLSVSSRIVEEGPRTSSMTSDRAGSSGTDSVTNRKNADGSVGPKSILKRRNGSPKQNSSEPEAASPMLPEIPKLSESPNSSAPSTPNDDGHKRVGSVAIGNEDYFVTALKLSQDGNGSTPRQSLKRNATFSPRIIFHDTWPSQEYDRRGEVSTCNRLTPLLAQQIKEELNSFKMEMVVHETSKIYTHFF